MFLSSCGYHFVDQNALSSRYATISVPYVEGDEDGKLTAAIIREIVSSGHFEYCSNGADLTLKVRIVDIDEENVGFRYDRKKKGKLTRDIIPTETRIFEVVELIVVDRMKEATLLGPVRLSAWIDFDHDCYFSRHGVNIFSLGQLIDIEAAYDAVQEPLHRMIAKKVAEYVTESW